MINLLREALKLIFEVIEMMVSMPFKRYEVKSVWEHYELLKDDLPPKTKSERRSLRLNWWLETYGLSKSSCAMSLFLWTVAFYNSDKNLIRVVILYFITLFVIYLWIHRYTSWKIKDGKNQKEALKMLYPDLFQPSKLKIAFKKAVSLFL